MTTGNERAAGHVRARALGVLALALLYSPPAWAQPKTDVVTLSNGDHITGEIEELARGRLRFDTDDAGTIDIEWDNVVSLVATRQFEVVTSDGRRLLGSLGRAAARSIAVVSADGDVSMNMLEVTSIAPIGASFWARFDGSLDAGFTYTRSSGIAQTSLNTEHEFRRPGFALRFQASATLTQTDGEEEDEADDRAIADAYYINYRGLRWFVVAGFRLETNESLGLALRTQGLGATGLRLVNTNRAQFEVSTGLVANEERGIDTEPTENLEGVMDARASFFTYDRPKTELSGSIQYYPSLSDWGRQRLQVDARVSRELWKDLHFSLNLFDTFDSDPPNPDAARNDVGVVTSLGWSY